MLLTKAAILAADDLKTANVAVPEWGEGAEVRIKALCLADSDKWRKSLLTRVESRDRATGKPSVDFVLDSDKFTTSEVLLITMGAVDADGAPLFEAGDVDELMKRSTAPMKRLVKAIMELSGLGKEAVDEAVKN